LVGVAQVVIEATLWNIRSIEGHLAETNGGQVEGVVAVWSQINGWFCRWVKNGGIVAATDLKIWSAKCTTTNGGLIDDWASF